MSHLEFDRAESPDPSRPTGRFQRSPRGVVLLCPGQGLMPQDLSEQLIASGDDLLQAYVQRLGGAAVDDPFRDFSSTQAALVAVAVGRARLALRMIADPPADFADYGPLLATAGHSLGELVALFVAGVVDGPQAVDIAVDRGASFDRVQDISWDDIGMMALVGRNVHTAIETGLLSRHGVEFANDNTPDQVVVVGALAGLQTLAEEAPSIGLRAVRLQTTGASHCSITSALCPDFLASLERNTFAPAQVPVYSNLTAEPFTDYPRELSSLLEQPVRWRESLLQLGRLRPAAVLDLGPGKALAKMARKTIDGVTAVSLDELTAARTAA